MAAKTILLKGVGVAIEAIASGTIKPGMLLERTSAASDTVKLSDLIIFLSELCMYI